MLKHLYFIVIIITMSIATKGIVLQKGVKYDNNGKIIDCLFCNITCRKEPANIVYENDEFTVFKTIAPASIYGHLLVTPKSHIKNVESLVSIEDANLIERMVAIGKSTYQNLGIDDIQYSFHIPPYNSIDHLHLHCIAKPKEMTFFSMMKYYQGSFWCKSAEEVITNLKSSNSKL